MWHSRLSLSNLSLEHRLPLLTGVLLLGIFLPSSWASYRGATESLLAVGRERMLNLRRQLATASRKLPEAFLTKIPGSANNSARRALQQSPSPLTQTLSAPFRQQLTTEQDLKNLQVKLWSANQTISLSTAERVSPGQVALETEPRLSAAQPFTVEGLSWPAIRRETAEDA
jgi:hypothetical protein